MAQAGRLSVLPRSHVRMGDEELVAQAHSGSGRAVEHLLGKYRNLVEGRASAYYMQGADHEDVVQEGMIGLFKAIRDFSADHLCAFRSFAEMCVNRQIITAVKTAQRHKHALLNTYLSMDLPVDSGDPSCTLGDTLSEASAVQPDEAAIGSEMQRQIRSRIRLDLSDLEARTLLRYMQGESYHEIASDLQLNAKQVDNALQRAKRKLARWARELAVS